MEYSKRVSLAIQRVRHKGKIFKELSFPGLDYAVHEDVEGLIVSLEEVPVKKHYILLKGSHSVRLDKAIDYL
jgi:hypothetical protein